MAFFCLAGHFNHWFKLKLKFSERIGFLCLRIFAGGDFSDLAYRLERARRSASDAKLRHGQRAPYYEIGLCFFLQGLWQFIEIISKGRPILLSDRSGFDFFRSMSMENLEGTLYPLFFPVFSGFGRVGCNVSNIVRFNPLR
jgi:hypothetical protein